MSESKKTTEELAKSLDAMGRERKGVLTVSMGDIRATTARLRELQAVVDRLPRTTKDRSQVVEGQTVYGVSPWGDIETLYVEPNELFASTTFPSDESGAAACSFPVWSCYATRAAALAAREGGDDDAS